MRAVHIEPDCIIIIPQYEPFVNPEIKKICYKSNRLKLYRMHKSNLLKIFALTKRLILWYNTNKEVIA